MRSPVYGVLPHPSTKALRRRLVLVSISLTLLAPGSWGVRSHAQADDPVPLDGVTAIVSAFERYPIVALGDLHGCQELYDFIAVLLRNADLPGKVNDIVVEFGNALYQDVADRYVSGESVTVAELSHVWRDHTNPIVFDSPVYEKFFETVREVNKALPENKRLRVLLGDPPIDWIKTTTNKDWDVCCFSGTPTSHQLWRRRSWLGAERRF